VLRKIKTLIDIGIVFLDTFMQIFSQILMPFVDFSLALSRTAHIIAYIRLFGRLNFLTDPFFAVNRGFILLIFVNSWYFLLWDILIFTISFTLCSFIVVRIIALNIYRLVKFKRIFRIKALNFRIFSLFGFFFVITTLKLLTDIIFFELWGAFNLRQSLPRLRPLKFPLFFLIVMLFAHFFLKFLYFISHLFDFIVEHFLNF